MICKNLKRSIDIRETRYIKIAQSHIASYQKSLKTHCQILFIKLYCLIWKLNMLDVKCMQLACFFNLLSKWISKKAFSRLFLCLQMINVLFHSASVGNDSTKRIPSNRGLSFDNSLHQGLSSIKWYTCHPALTFP